ncbi:stress protein [Phytophthora citrophthora]|uniref:Stress protein n=1 Tax=Phytophthora citrophthora TaxID=4793 RepID=A0AAD9G429_9STRA|nr:stress protein [Phytophthora citrophthora]
MWYQDCCNTWVHGFPRRHSQISPCIPSTDKFSTMATPSNPTEKVPPPALKATVGPSPTTNRGAPSVLGIHPKEPKLIYCSGKLVVVRNLEDPSDTFVYKGHNEPTTVAKFSPNGYWVASGDVSGKVRVWSYDNPEHTLKLEIPVFAGEIKDLSWDPDSKRIVAVGDGRGLMARVFMWDTGNSIGEIVGHQKRILSVDYRQTRPFRIMTASEDFNVCVFEGPPFKFKQNNNNLHSNFVNCVRFSPNGELAVSVGSDKLMCLYDGKSGELVDKFPAAHQASIYSVCWSPDGTQLLTSSADKTVLLWDVASRSVVTKFTFGGAKPQVKDMQVAVAWCQNHLISLSLSGDLNFLDLENPSQPKKIIQGHQVSILSLATEPTQNRILTGSYDGVVCSWSAKTATTLAGTHHTAKITGISANSTQVASSGWDDQLRFANDSEYTAATALNAQPNGVALTESGLAVTSTNKGVKLLRDQKLVFETPEFSWTPTCVAISPSEDLVAVGSQEDMKIHLFDVVNGSSLVESGEIAGHLGALTCVSFSPDGSLLAAGDTYREVRVWDVASRSAKVQGMWVFHSTRVTSVAWAPSGNFIASGSLDERIYIWDVNSPMKKRVFDFSHKDGVTGVSFVSENELVSVGNDACVNYWDLSA